MNIVKPEDCEDYNKAQVKEDVLPWSDLESIAFTVELIRNENYCFEEGWVGGRVGDSEHDWFSDYLVCEFYPLLLSFPMIAWLASVKDDTRKHREKIKLS